MGEIILDIPIDVWQVIGGFLESDDLFAMAATCKRAYKAFSRPILRKKISFPLKEPYRLTMDQREAIKAMESVNFPVKLLSSSVGSGKSISSIAYGLRNNFTRIYIVTPPNLIQMWWDTVVKFFDLEPAVFHSTNKKYHRNASKQQYDNKIIITSYLLFKTITLLDNEDSLLIVDEAHHTFEHENRKFKERIGLSATAYNKKEISRGLKDMCDQYGVKPEEIIFRMENTVIAKKLPPYETVPPYLFKAPKELQNVVKTHFNYTKEGAYDLRHLNTITEYLTHVYSNDPMCLISHFKVGKKKFNVGDWRNYETLRYNISKFLGLTEHELVIPQHLSIDEQIEIIRKHDSISSENRRIVTEYIKEETENYYNAEKRKCIKYYQLLAILENVKRRGEKAIVIDNSVKWAPVVYRFLMEKDIETYLFSTDYDVTSRQNQLKKFKEKDTAVALLSSFGMLGEGHNITEANHVIFLSPNMDINKYHQAIGRAHRYPQTKTVYVYHLFVSKLEEAIYEHAHDYRRLEGRNLEDLLSS